MVSHDERLIQMICKELWLCRDGSVKSIEGGYDTYRKLIEKELKELRNLIDKQAQEDHPDDLDPELEEAREKIDDAVDRREAAR